MYVVTNDARAYVNHGRWIADCPNDCGNALQLEPNQTTFHCGGAGGCGQISPVEWPADRQEIWDALMERPRPKNRNWFPVGHKVGVRGNCPQGQTAKELRDEASEFGGQ